MDKQVTMLSKPYWAMDVANYLVQHFANQGQPIINSLLLKILYYAQADSLRKTGKPLFTDKIEKWGYGPIVPVVYSYFKSYGAAPIKEMQQYVLTDKNNAWTLIKPEERQLAKDDTYWLDKLADEIQTKFTKNSFDLVKLTQKEQIWLKDKLKIKAGNMHIHYTNQEIKDYYSDNVNWPWNN